MEANKKVVIFQCDGREVAYRDIGRLIDVAREVICHFGADNIIPYFIISATQDSLKEVIIRFKTESKYAFSMDVDKQVYSQDNPALKQIYPKADIIFTFSTPLPESISKENDLNKQVEIVNITGHCNASLSGPAWSYPHLHHYVTGISKYDSGLMVRDKTIDPVKALQSITDISYIEALGLKTPVSDQAANQFIKNTLVVPVYLDESQQRDLAPLIHLVSQSPLARKFNPIIFHVNQRAYDAATYTEMDALLQKRPDTPSVQLIVGHYFENLKDFQRIFQLSSGKGIAIVSSDKTLELAISCDLMPLYSPVMSKRHMHRSLHDFVEDIPDLNKLQLFLGKTVALKKKKTTEHQTMMQALLQDDSICDCLNKHAITVWKETKRPVLLATSFNHVLHNEILDHQPSHDLERKSKYALKLFKQDLMDDNTRSGSKKLFDEIEAAENGKQTYTHAFINSLIVIILEKDERNTELYNQMLSHLKLDVEGALFSVKNYLNLSPALTGISEADKKNLSADWAEELKFVWTTSREEQLQWLRKVVIWANQLPDDCRYGILQSICRELDVAVSEDVI